VVGGWSETRALRRILGRKRDEVVGGWSETRALRRIFGPKRDEMVGRWSETNIGPKRDEVVGEWSETRALRRDEVVGGWRKLHNEALHNLSSSVIGMTKRIRWEGHVARLMKMCAYRIRVGKTEGKRPLGRPRRKIIL
jgi:hypothetical protein